MSDLLKWGILLGVFLVLITSLLSVADMVSELAFFEGVNKAITQGVSVAFPILLEGRKLLNNFFIPEILSVLLYFSIFLPFLRLSARISTAIVRFIYK